MVVQIKSAADAEQIARDKLRDIPGRLLHIAAVAAAAERIQGTVPPSQQWLLRAAAWLHDLGYAPDVVETGFHSLDGASFLQRNGAHPQLVALVGHHTSARYEAEERGLAADMAAIPKPDVLLLDVLTYADLISGPEGQHVTVNARIAEVLRRYEPTHPVHRAMRRAEPDLRAATRRVDTRLNQTGAMHH